MHIGWKEWAALPDLGIDLIHMKTDTGAKTSCLHAFKIETFQQGNHSMVRFWVHPNQDETDTVVECEAEIIDEREVKNSGGQIEKRYVIETTLVIGKYSYPIQLTLSNRENMRFNMLFGRRAMNDGVLVEPNGSNLQGKPYVGPQPNKRHKRKKKPLAPDENQ